MAEMGTLQASCKENNSDTLVVLATTLVEFLLKWLQESGPDVKYWLLHLGDLISHSEDALNDTEATV